MNKDKDTMEKEVTDEETIGQEEELIVTDDEHPDDEAVRDPSEVIAELEQKLATEHERLLRTAADLDNLRKRTRREIDEAGIRGRAEVLGELLPAIDSLDLALASAEQDGPAGPVLDGVEMVRRQFLAAMGRFGLKPVAIAPGDVFDPVMQEAVAQIPSRDHEAGTIIEEMRKGYLLGERLLRAAMVVVSAGDPEKTNEQGDDPRPEEGESSQKEPEPEDVDD